MFKRLVTAISTTIQKSFHNFQQSPQLYNHHQQQFLHQRYQFQQSYTINPFKYIQPLSYQLQYKPNQFIYSIFKQQSFNRSKWIKNPYFYLAAAAAPALTPKDLLSSQSELHNTRAEYQRLEEIDPSPPLPVQPNANIPKRRKHEQNIKNKKNAERVELEQYDRLNPQGRIPNPIPAVAWFIKRDSKRSKYKEIIKNALEEKVVSRPPKWNEDDPEGSIRKLATRIIFDLHRSSCALSPVAQHLSLINTLSQMYNRDRGKVIIPMFDLDRLASFQRRLVNRYRVVLNYIDKHDLIQDEHQSEFSIDELKNDYDALSDAYQLGLFDLSVLYAIDSAVEQYHPKHIKGWIQRSIRGQAEFAAQRRKLIAKQLRDDLPNLNDQEFQRELNKRVVHDTQVLNEALEQRRIQEQKRWDQTQRAQILRTRQRRKAFLDYTEHLNEHGPVQQKNKSKSVRQFI